MCLSRDTVLLGSGLDIGHMKNREEGFDEEIIFFKHAYPVIREKKKTNFLTVTKRMEEG